MKYSFLILITFILIVQSSVMAQISTDAGLTPAQDRWIFRTQYRMAGMENSMMKTSTQMVPMVLGYGITSWFSIMVRNVYVHKSYSNSNEVNSGINDLYLLSKFRLLRKNTSNYSFGVAPFVASNIPIGSKSISDRTWDPEIGLNISFRPRFLSIDFSTYYTFADATEKLSTNHLNRYNLDVSFSGKIPLTSESNQILSPVLEFNYYQEGKKNNYSSANELLFISPGISYKHSSLAIEALYQIPVYELDKADRMYQLSRWIFGFKYLF